MYISYSKFSVWRSLANCLSAKLEGENKIYVYPTIPNSNKIVIVIVTFFLIKVI